MVNFDFLEEIFVFFVSSEATIILSHIFSNEFSEFSEFWFKEYADFKSAIINCRQFADFGLKNSDKVNSIYNDPNLEKGHYCEAVIREIEKL